MYTDSGHYLLPTDRFSISLEERNTEQKTLKEAFWKHIEDLKDFDPVVVRNQHVFASEADDTVRTGSRVSGVEENKPEPRDPEVMKQTEKLDEDDEEIEESEAMHVSTKATVSSLRKRLNMTRLTQTALFYAAWMSLGAAVWNGDCWPAGAADSDVKQWTKDYAAMPEEFYTTTKYPLIIPDTCETFVNMTKSLKVMCLFQEVCSGSSRLTLKASRYLVVAFPVDFRYGWDLRKKEHCVLISWTRQTLGIEINFYSPTCKPWSQSANRSNPEAIQARRAEQEPILKWIVSETHEIDADHNSWIVENPKTSRAWRQSPLTVLSDDLPPVDAPMYEKSNGRVVPNTTDQCSKGATIDTGEKVQKSTLFKSRRKLRHTSTLCHCKLPHGELQGQVNGISRTALAAVYPRKLCDDLIKDFISLLNDKYTCGMYAIKEYWSCIRCRDGAASGVPHSRIKGKCKYAPKDAVPAADTEAVPAPAPASEAAASSEPAVEAPAEEPPKAEVETEAKEVEGELKQENVTKGDTVNVKEEKIEVAPTAASLKPNFDLKDFAAKLNASESEEYSKSLLMGLHLRFWHVPGLDMANFLRLLQIWTKEQERWCHEVCKGYPECNKFVRAKSKPTVKSTIAWSFNMRVQGDLWFIWDLTTVILIDECIRWKLADVMPDKTAESWTRVCFNGWIKYFGPFQTLIHDQQGTITSELVGRFCDRFCIRRDFAGHDDSTHAGLAERHIMLTRLMALKTWEDVQRTGLEVNKEQIISEAAMSQNLFLNHGGSTPSQSSLGYTPRDLYSPDMDTLESYQSSVEVSPDPIERAVRLRLLSKQNTLKTVIEERIARANRSRPQNVDLSKLDVGSQVDVFRVPDRKDQSGWRGPRELVKLSKDGSKAIIVWNDMPYMVSMRFIRPHIFFGELFLLLHGEVFKVEVFEAMPGSQELWVLMDYVDGSPAGVSFQYGRQMTKESLIIHVPPDIDVMESQQWKLATKVAKVIFSMAHIDGIIYGSSLRRFEPVAGAHYGKLVTWKRSSRHDYLTYTVQPRQVVHLDHLCGADWLDRSAMIFYAFHVPEDPGEHHKYDMPDFADISNIYPPSDHSPMPTIPDEPNDVTMADSTISSPSQLPQPPSQSPQPPQPPQQPSQPSQPPQPPQPPQ